LKFYRNRVARVIPLLSLVALLGFGFEILRGGGLVVEGAKMILTATGAFGFTAAGVTANSVGAWSLGVEFVFYALFPIIAILTYNSKLSNVVYAAIIVNVLQLVNNLFVFNYISGTDYWQLYVMPLSFASYFAWGMVLAQLPERQSSLGWLGFPLIFAVVWVSAIIDVSDAALLAWPGALIVPLSLAVATHMITSWSAPLRLVPVLNFLGSISYSIYLLHPPIYFLITRMVWPAGTGNPFAFVLVLTGSSMIVAWLAHRIFEQPMRDILRGRPVAKIATQRHERGSEA
jgi:peptidoglycan/LPS O-acetylase OafA/YrhL